MFRGWHEHTMDQKGRVSIPQAFRNLLQEKYTSGFVLTNFDECLLAYPLSEWEALERKVATLSTLKPEVKHFERFFISSACECELDGHGRILVPGHLRQFANLEKEVVFVGLLKKIEIWSKVKWQNAFLESQKKFGEISNVLADLGI